MVSAPSLDEIGLCLQQASLTEAGADEAPPPDSAVIKLVPGFARHVEKLLYKHRAGFL